MVRLIYDCGRHQISMRFFVIRELIVLPDSIKNAAKLAAKNMMAHYTGDQPGQIPGLLPLPYYWWLAGAMFGQLIHYWNLTGDTTYNDKTMEALLFQIGDDKNYMPQNRSKDLVGNQTGDQSTCG